MGIQFVRRLLCVIALSLALNACGKEEKRSSAALDGTFRWGTFPINIRVDESLLDRNRAEDDLMEAIRFWEKRAARHLFALSGWKSGDLPYTGSPENPSDLLENVIFFQAPWPHDPRVAGKTIYFAENGIIRKGAIFLNAETDLCSGLCRNEQNRTSRRKLLAHELGHLLGLNHVDDRENVMFPEILPGGSLQKLKVEEAAFLRLVK